MASAILAAGVDISKFVSGRTEKRVKTLFNPETGVPRDVEYDQMVYTIFGKDIEIKKKELLTSYLPNVDHSGRFEVGYSMEVELKSWLAEHGFCPPLVHCSHTTTHHSPPNGVLGIPVWVDRHDGVEDYGYVAHWQDTPFRSVGLEEIAQKLRLAGVMLEAVGCPAVPHLYVISRG